MYNNKHLHHLNISKFVIQTHSHVFSTPNCVELNSIECKNLQVIIHFSSIFRLDIDPFSSTYIECIWITFHPHTEWIMGHFSSTYWGHGTSNREETCHQQVITFGGRSEPWPRGAPMKDGWMEGLMDGWMTSGWEIISF